MRPVATVLVAVCLVCGGCLRSGFDGASPSDGPPAPDRAVLDLALADLPVSDLPADRGAADAAPLIAGVSGDISLEPAPASAQFGAWESDATMRLFQERSVTLSGALGVDIDSPGSYAVFSTLSAASIAPQTQVTSFLLHVDPVGSTWNRFTGAVTFSVPVLGLIVSTSQLAASDATLGAPGTTYEQQHGGRGLDDKEDGISLSADRRQLTLSLGADIALDEMRIVVGQ